MRDAFLKRLTSLADRDARVMLLTGDLGYTVVEQFARAHPRRFLNVGVAEQNMVGIATGLAAEGLLPFVYSITPFAVFRPYEFIRNGAVLHQLPVRIVGVGAGVDYGPNGPTHYALEDLAVMRPLQGLTIISPADRDQAVAALDATWSTSGPVYYRLGKDDSCVVPGLDGRYDDAGATVLREGAGIAIVVTGAIAVEVEVAAGQLAASGVHARVIVVSRISPPPEDLLRELLTGISVVVTVEAHSIRGGLGGMVAEITASMDPRGRIVRLGFDVLPRGISGPGRLMLEQAGLDAASIRARVMDELNYAA